MPRTLPRTPLDERTGTLVRWCGSFGWVRDDDAATLPADLKKGRKDLYVALQDLPGAGKVQRGDKVAFRLYADADGLGAQDVELAGGPGHAEPRAPVPSPELAAQPPQPTVLFLGSAPAVRPLPSLELVGKENAALNAPQTPGKRTPGKRTPGKQGQRPAPRASPPRASPPFPGFAPLVTPGAFASGPAWGGPTDHAAHPGALPGEPPLPPQPPPPPPPAGAFASGSAWGGPTDHAAHPGALPGEPPLPPQPPPPPPADTDAALAGAFQGLRLADCEPEVPWVAGSKTALQQAWATCTPARSPPKAAPQPPGAYSPSRPTCDDDAAFWRSLASADAPSAEPLVKPLPAGSLDFLAPRLEGALSAPLFPAGPCFAAPLDGPVFSAAPTAVLIDGAAVWKGLVAKWRAARLPGEPTPAQTLAFALGADRRLWADGRLGAGVTCTWFEMHPDVWAGLDEQRGKLACRDRMRRWYADLAALGVQFDHANCLKSGAGMQKGVDANAAYELAVAAGEVARGACGRLVFVGGDADFLPALVKAREKCGSRLEVVAFKRSTNAEVWARLGPRDLDSVPLPL